MPNVHLQSNPLGSNIVNGGDDKGFPKIEEIFEYCFSLKLRNGSIVDLPSGHMAFVPSVPFLAFSRSIILVTVPVEHPKLSTPDWTPGVNFATAPLPTAGADNEDCHFQSGEWSCLISRLLLLPHFFNLRPGTWLSATFCRISGSAQHPRFISFRPQTVESKTRSASFAHLDEERIIIALGHAELGHPGWMGEPDSGTKIKLPSRSSLLRRSKSSAKEKIVGGLLRLPQLE